MSDYKSILCISMSWKDGNSYSNDYSSFSSEELNSITPNDVYRYFKYLAYGDADCDKKTANPTQQRSNSLKYSYKKAISVLARTGFALE